jgi:internalin A
METPARNSCRRYARFSVRGLIVLVLVIAVVLGWVVHRAQVQRDAVAAIRKAGGSIQYDWQYKDGQAVRSGRPRGPMWMADRLGADYFDTVTTVLGKPTRRKCLARSPTPAWRS